MPPHDKRKIVSLETVVNELTTKTPRPYTFTIAPDDNHQQWNEEGARNNKRLEVFTDEYSLYLYKLMGSHAIDYSLHLECSPGGRLHYHGIIMFKSKDAIKDFYVNVIHKLLNTNMVEIDTIADIDVWLTYCSKQDVMFEKYAITNQSNFKRYGKMPLLGGKIKQLKITLE